ncbi:methylase of polypeptide subunit release factors [Glycomyces algeriensis]|nr:methylase of polypeptide subunit release factors [Glycomyces algeriensis]
MRLLQTDAAARLGEAFRGFRRAALSAVYGDDAMRAADRGDYRALLAQCGDDRLGVLTRLFVIGVPVPAEEAVSALAPLGFDEARECGLVWGNTEYLAGWGAQFSDDRLLFSDQLPNTTGGRTREHVLGVGGASKLLLDVTLRTPVGSALDLGTGCGVQALGLADHAERVTATDLSERAVAFAELNAVVNGVELELLQGDLLAPVEGRRFDLVVANPPFVIGTPGSGWTYRDGGREGDGLAAELAAAAADLLNPGGTMQFLANWLHVAGEDWAERVTGWFPDEGLQVWAVERERLDPLDYVRTWQRDSGEDHDAEQAAAWLAWFETASVAGVGFGFINVRRTEGPTTVVCEEARHAVETPWRDRVQDWFAVRDRDLEPETLWQARLRVADGVVLQQTAGIGDEGWDVDRQWLQQANGMRYAEELDPLLVQFMGACDGEAEVRLQVQLLADTYGAAPAMLYAQLYPVIRRLVERGFLALRAQVGQDRLDAAVVVAVLAAQRQLREDVADVLLDRAVGDEELLADRLVGVALGHEAQDLLLARGEGRDRVVLPAAHHELRDDLGVEDRAAPGDPLQRVHEVVHVDHTVLQQVAHRAAGVREEVVRVGDLHVLAEDEHRRARHELARAGRGPQPLVGEGRRHPHVHHRHVGPVLGDGLHEGVAVTDLGDHFAAELLQEPDQAGADEHGVIGHHYTHGTSTTITVGPPSGESMVHWPSTALTRSVRPESPCPFETCAPPIPLSPTERTSLSPQSSTATVALDACECLAMLVRHSAVTK